MIVRKKLAGHGDKMKLAYCLVLLALAPGRGSVWAATTKIGATLTSVQGDVYISTGPRASRRPAEKGMRCAPGAVVMTIPGGSAELLFEDGTALRIESNTLFVVRKAEREKSFREFLVEMVYGKILSNIPKINKSDKAKYQMKSPACVAAVRGTAFVMEVSSAAVPSDKPGRPLAAAATVAVFEGRVRAENPSTPGAVEVGVGRQTDVLAGRAPAAAHSLSAAMEDYRTNIAALFAQRIGELRSDMEAVRAMNQDYMDRRQEKIQNDMDSYQDDVQQQMENFRKNTTP